MLVNAVLVVVLVVVPAVCAEEQLQRPAPRPVPPVPGSGEPGEPILQPGHGCGLQPGVWLHRGSLLQGDLLQLVRGQQLQGVPGGEQHHEAGRVLLRPRRQ